MLSGVTAAPGRVWPMTSRAPRRCSAAARRVLEDAPAARARQRCAVPSGPGRAGRDGRDPARRQPSCSMVDTACSSSLYAVDIGDEEPAARHRRRGGVRRLVRARPARGGPVLQAARALHGRRGARRSTEGADGVLFSDGAGVVVLKRLSRARADGDRVLGLVAGLGSSSDGKGKAIYAPSAAGQRLAVERAMHAPGVDPRPHRLGARPRHRHAGRRRRRVHQPAHEPAGRGIRSRSPPTSR